MHEYLKSVRKAIRLMYAFIISIAVTEALKSLFKINNIFEIPQQKDLFLFLIFFSFIVRFFIGAYRVISYDIEVEIRRAKIIIDSTGFFIQAILFYIFSLIYHNFIYTEWLIFIICIVDLVWLVLLAVIYKIMDDTYGQWTIHNLIVAVFILINIYWLKNLEALLIVSIIAFVVDFVYNREFYFTLRKTPGLRVFIAGPYGDYKSKEEIEKNVEEAKRVGKEIALKGHYPFIPHTMLHGWEKDERFTVNHFRNIDFQWLEFCDALFFIDESPGANKEKEIATKKGLQIFDNLDKVPTVSA